LNLGEGRADPDEKTIQNGKGCKQRDQNNPAMNHPDTLPYFLKMNE
jgi:hypothetical protein